MVSFALSRSSHVTKKDCHAFPVYHHSNFCASKLLLKRHQNTFENVWTLLWTPPPWTNWQKKSKFFCFFETKKFVETCFRRKLMTFLLFRYKAFNNKVKKTYTSQQEDGMNVYYTVCQVLTEEKDNYYNIVRYYKRFAEEFAKDIFYYSNLALPCMKMKRQKLLDFEQKIQDEVRVILARKSLQELDEFTMFARDFLIAVKKKIVILTRIPKSVHVVGMINIS